MKAKEIDALVVPGHVLYSVHRFPGSSHSWLVKCSCGWIEGWMKSKIRALAALRRHRARFIKAGGEVTKCNFSSEFGDRCIREEEHHGRHSCNLSELFATGCTCQGWKMVARASHPGNEGPANSRKGGTE